MSFDVSLVADIGGTHARFALVDESGVVRPETYRCADYTGPAEAARAYLAEHGGDTVPVRGAFAVASVLSGDRVAMTNSPWNFSIEETRRVLALSRLETINDFTAIALAVPHLEPDHLVTLGGGTALPNRTVAVLGPGTGLGVSALVPCGSSWFPLEAEGGHVTMAAANARESEILEWLRQRFDHVSAERLLSGQGLVNLYQALSALSGHQAVYSTPDVISSHGLDGSCPICRETIDTFFAMLGTVAGNLALTVGAVGGVYLAGGILPRMAEAFRHSGFRARFEAHGRFQPYLAAIPTRLIVHPLPAFVGLAALVRSDNKA